MRATACREFQSLFSWNLLLMAWDRAANGDRILVSILVFVELALDEAFSVAVLNMVPVSILVFVELALDGRMR